MSAAFWYKPNVGSGLWRAVYLNAALTARSGPTYKMDQEYVQTVGGAGATQHFSGLQTIQIEYTFECDLTDPSSDNMVLRRQLVALCNHLQRGGSCMFAENSDVAWAAKTLLAPSNNQSQIGVSSNLFPVAHANMDGRHVYIHSDSYGALCEMQALLHDNTAIGYVELYETTTYDYEGSNYVIVREEGSYPSLRLNPGQRNAEVLVTDDNRVFTLKMTLEEDVGALFSITELDDPAPDPDTGGASTGGQGSTGSAAGEA